MDSANTERPPRDDAPRADAPAGAPGLSASALALWDDLRGLAHEHLQLAALEARRAGESLVSMLAYAIVAGVLAASAWVGATGALVLWLIDCGIAASAALLLAAFLNALGAFGFALAIRRKSRFLSFPATVRSLRHDGQGAAATTEQT